MSEWPLFREAQRDLELGRLALAVYDVLRDWLDLIAWRQVKIVELEQRFGRSRPQISGALRELVERGYIERGERAHKAGPYLYRLVYSRTRTEQPPGTPQPSGRGGGYGMVSRGEDW